MKPLNEDDFVFSFDSFKDQIKSMALEYYGALDKILFEILEEKKCTIQDLNILEIKLAEEDPFKDGYIVFYKQKQIREIYGTWNLYGYSIKQFELNQQGQIVPLKGENQ